MAVAAPAQMTLDLAPAITMMDAASIGGTHKRRITKVRILYVDAPWWMVPATDKTVPVIAVFRNHEPLYRSFAYRPGLRYARFCRMAEAVG